MIDRTAGLEHNSLYDKQESNCIHHKKIHLDYV